MPIAALEWGLDMSITTIARSLFRRNLRRLGTDSDGQDLIEYALMAGLVATGVVTMSPAVAVSFTHMMSTVNSVIVLAGAS
jgi:Flp pilus assembly pilin Flp